MSQPERTPGARYGRYVLGLLLVILVLFTINTAVNKPNEIRGVEPGHRLPPFAVPLASGDLQGAADVATHANDGGAGRVPACSERGPQILNVCELYEQGPVVVALFVDAGSCPNVLGDLQALAPSFPGVRIAAVAIKGNHASVRRLVKERSLNLPVGVDIEGALATVYKVVTCPQLTFAYPGGVVQSRAILTRPTRAALRARLNELVAASRARGWRGAAK
jgi:AhpC/TSA family